MYQKVVSIPAGRDNHYFSPPPSARNGLGFEEFVLRQIAIAGGSSGADLRFHRSPRAGDDGKDIIINGQLSELFGQRMGANVSKTICEVKYSSGGLLKLSRFADTLIRVEEDVSDVVIICNNTPSPRTIYYANKQIELVGKRLHFISGTELNLFFKDNDTQQEDHLVCVQLDERSYPNKVHFYLKNLSSTATRSFFINSRRDEVTRTDNQLEFLVGPGEFYCGESSLLDVGEIVDGGVINFEVIINDQSYDLKLNRHLDTKSITLPFWGSTNLEHLAECKASLSDDNPSSMIMIEGGAGVGKSRLTIEIAYSIRALGRPVLVVNPVSIINKDHLDKQIKRESEYLHSLFKDLTQQEPIDLILALSEADPLNSILLIFEDTHQYSEALLSRLQNALLSYPDASRPGIVFTARNDDSFFNPAYFIFAEQIRSEIGATKSLFLKPLPREEEKNLIAHIVSHISKATIERIQYISNGNPFHLILTLEWLVENDLFQIVNNQRIAVVDSKRFADQNTLPIEIEEMFKQSLSSLSEHLAPAMVTQFAILALYPEYQNHAECPISPPQFQSNAFLDSFSLTSESWRHELAKSAFLKLILEDTEFTDVRHCVFDYVISEKLPIPRADMALLAYFCDETDRAWQDWEELRAKILDADNITSIDFDNSCFDSFIHLSRLCFAKGETHLAVQALVVWCYLGCHYANLAIGQAACERSLVLIEEFVPNNYSSEINAIRALELRALIDSGLVNQARGKVLECEIALSSDNVTQKETHSFDYYLNRSDLQRLLNDRTGALHFLEVACQQTVAQLGSLSFVEQSHKAELELNPNPRIASLKRLIDPEEPHGSERHLLIAECMLVRSEFLSRTRSGGNAITEVKRSLQRAKKMVERQYMSALPIAYRAAAIASYCAFAEADFDPRAVRDLYRIAENSCVLKGETESLPLVLNDMAIIEYNITNRSQDTMMYMATAIDVLNRQGRLDLGKADLTSANQIIISNYLRLLSKVGYARTVDFILDRIQWYDKSETFSRGWVTKELDRMNDTGLPFLSETSGIFLLQCQSSNLTLVG